MFVAPPVSGAGLSSVNRAELLTLITTGSLLEGVAVDDYREQRRNTVAPYQERALGTGKRV